MAVKMTDAMRPVDFGASRDGSDEPLEEAGAFRDRREAQGSQDQPDGGEHRRHATAGEERIDRFVARCRYEARRKRRIDGLDPGDEIALLRFVDERHDERRLREQGEDPANTAQPKMARNSGAWRTLRTTRSTSGSRLSSEIR